MLKIRVMNISKKDLHKTLKRFKGTAWDQSPIFKKLYEEEYGQLGGEPYGCLVARLPLRPQRRPTWRRSVSSPRRRPQRTRR